MNDSSRNIINNNEAGDMSGNNRRPGLSKFSKQKKDQNRSGMNLNASLGPKNGANN